MTWLLAITALAFMIVVHEAGHFIVARMCGMRVERFSIGFGPGILKRRSRRGTVFQLAPIPFGGFVEIRGMNIAEDIDPDDKEAYPNRPAWQRFVTIFAGPATNYISAIVLAFLLFTCHGVRSEERWFGVGKVMPDGAAIGKLERGDRIVAVDGVPLFAHVKDDGLTKRVVARSGQPVTLTVERSGARFDVEVQPKRNPDPKASATWLIGIQPQLQHNLVDVGIVEGVGRSLVYPVEQTKVILGGLHDIVTGKEKADPGGPVRIVEEFESAFSYSWVTGIEFLMMLSVYLGLFNLFPLPALDGGRLVFLTYELVTRRRANPRIETMVHMGGIMVLFVVMILVTLNDCNVF